jgi:hypothetical protein
LAQSPQKLDPTAKLSKQLDKELAQKAVRKVMEGERPTAKEAAALRRHEAEQEEVRRWQYYEAIPQKHWWEMSGRQTKVVNEQAERYGIPFEEDDPLLNSDVASPALERYREERAAMARLDRLEREGQLVARGDAREGLGRVAAILRAAGDGLLQQFGRDAVELLNEALTDAEREIERLSTRSCGSRSRTHHLLTSGGESRSRLPGEERSQAGRPHCRRGASHMMAAPPTLQARAKIELLWFPSQSRARTVRSMREFAESEVVIPDGPFQGRRFRCDRQPYTKLWFDAVDSGHWNRCVATGPTQSGKTLACFVIPLIYHLFEIGETVICGLPDMDMAVDKWREDILPVIEQSRYRNMMPIRGGGSRGGRVESIPFRNGATLKFMSGGGGDKSRAGFTSRVVVITETDGMDKPGATSRESDKITQLEARTRAYGSRKRIYMECTLSTEQGRTWQEHIAGTRNKIVLPCPHCRHYVLPDRQHFTGWHEASSQAEARGFGRFGCPDCGEIWTPEQRTEANRHIRLVHQGQDVDDEGNVAGDAVATDTLGFRWSAIHNLFLTPADLAADEWRAARSPDEENAEREMRQFVWCLPVAPSKQDETSLHAEEIMLRQSNWPRGLVPPDCTILTAAIDMGKYLCHWIVMGWRPDASCYIVDYGRIESGQADHPRRRELPREPAVVRPSRPGRDGR